MEHIRHWIAGSAWSEPGRVGDVFNPATGEIRASVEFASAGVVDRAVAVAVDAFSAWKTASLAKRTAILFAFRELMDKRKNELAEIVTAEHGKVLSDALGEVQRGLEVADFACGLPHLLKGSHSENVSTQVDAYSIRQPIGVCAVISPFNFPAMVPMWFLPMAIAAGNTVILKPSEKDPSASCWIAELWKEAGLPDGVLNVVHGDKLAVNRLLEHPDVRAISFVGSTPVACYVYETGTRYGKRVQALGGAKNHMVVLPDADLDLAADAAVSAGFGSAGERCMAISVVVAVDPIADALITRIKERMASIKVGEGHDASCDMGPLITQAHRDRVASYLDAGSNEGATVVVDGRNQSTAASNPDGFWLGPSLLDHVEPQMTIYTDEIFGPVLSVVRVPTFADALDVVNRSPYGNGTAIFTSDGGLAREYQTQVEVGMVGINTPIPVPMAYYSFGGWKDSLFGDLHAYGTEGIHFFTRGKAVTARWPNVSHARLAFGFPTST